LRRSKDSITRLVFGRLVSLELGWRLQDDTGELRSRDPGESRLVLVFAADLEEIKEIGRRGVNGYEIVIGPWDRIRKLYDLEIVRTLYCC
jgi:hypothetical protein